MIAERTQDMAVMRAMVGNNFGYSFANVRPLSDTSPDGQPVSVVPISGEVRARRMGLLTAQDADRSNAVRTLSSYVSDMVKSGALAQVGGEPLV